MTCIVQYIKLNLFAIGTPKTADDKKLKQERARYFSNLIVHFKDLYLRINPFLQNKQNTRIANMKKEYIKGTEYIIMVFSTLMIRFYLLTRNRMQHFCVEGKAPCVNDTVKVLLFKFIYSIKCHLSI